MLSDFTGVEKVYTDLRQGIDGLSALMRLEFDLDPFSNTLLLFCGRRRDRIKALYWEGNGFVLLYKRLESGSFQWPRKESEARALTPQQYRWLMEGFSIPVKGLETVQLPENAAEIQPAFWWDTGYPCPICCRYGIIEAAKTR